MFNPNNREEDEETKQKRERNAGWNYSGMEEVLGDGSVRACNDIICTCAASYDVHYVFGVEWSGQCSILDIFFLIYL
jgi:hypothetical protein